jgi:hypothetical protein
MPQMTNHNLASYEYQQNHAFFIGMIHAEDDRQRCNSDGNSMANEIRNLDWINHWWSTRNDRNHGLTNVTTLTRTLSLSSTSHTRKFNWNFEEYRYPTSTQ